MFWTTFWMIILCIVLPSGAVIFFCHLKDKKERNANETYLNNYNGLIKSIKDVGFEITKTLIITDEWSIGAPVEYKKHIFLDEKAKKMAFVDYTRFEPIIINYTDFIDYDVYENNGHDSNWLGTGTTTMCKEMNLIFRINSYEHPQVMYQIMYDSNNIGIPKTNEKYRACWQSVQSLISFLEVIKRENQTASKLKRTRNKTEDKNKKA